MASYLSFPAGDKRVPVSEKSLDKAWESEVSTTALITGAVTSAMRADGMGGAVLIVLAWEVVRDSKMTKKEGLRQAAEKNG